MEQWHYDPAVDFDALEQERLRSILREPGLLVSGLRSLSAVVLRCWLRVYHRLTIVGRQNLPTDRSFVLIANHTSHLDALCLLSALSFRQLRCAFPAAARDYFCSTALRAQVARVLVNALPFDRRFAPWQCLSVCAHLLEKPGTILVFFPEGTRGNGSELSEFKPGVALLVAGRDIPVVPCYLSGTYAALPKGSWCPRPKAVRLTIGPPRVYAHLPATKESAKHICRELHDAVLSLGMSERSPLSSNARSHELQ
jgi:1-acyl-sn-glycerol-3-phosphate acyltransferase